MFLQVGILRGRRVMRTERAEREDTQHMESISDETNE